MGHHASAERQGLHSAGRKNNAESEEQRLLAGNEAVRNEVARLRSAGSPGSIKVEKLKPLGYLKILTIPGERLRRQGKNRFEVTEVVKGWVVPEAASIRVSPTQMFKYDALITDDSNIFIDERLDQGVVEGVFSTSALNSIESEGTGHKYEASGQQRIHWDKIHRQLGAIALPLSA